MCSRDRESTAPFFRTRIISLFWGCLNTENPENGNTLGRAEMGRSGSSRDFHDRGSRSMGASGHVVTPTLGRPRFAKPAEGLPGSGGPVQVGLGRRSRFVRSRPRIPDGAGSFRDLGNQRPRSKVESIGLIERAGRLKPKIWIKLTLWKVLAGNGLPKKISLATDHRLKCNQRAAGMPTADSHQPDPGEGRAPLAKPGGAGPPPRDIPLLPRMEPPIDRRGL